MKFEDKERTKRIESKILDTEIKNFNDSAEDFKFDYQEYLCRIAASPNEVIDRSNPCDQLAVIDQCPWRCIMRKNHLNPYHIMEPSKFRDDDLDLRWVEL